MRGVLFAAVLAAGVLATAMPARSQAKPAPAADPVIVFETVKGAIEMELFQAEAPKSVAHILDLMKRSFYRGQRFHRVLGSLIQVGDPQSRNMSRQDSWGTSNSGRPIGVFEWSKKRLHVRGAVALAHSGDPARADSQIYIMKTASPGLDGKHAVIGRVVAGMTVVDRIAVADMIKDAKIK